MAGAFTYIGPNTGTAGLFDWSTETYVEKPRVTGFVLSTLFDNQGGYFVAGNVSQVGNIQVNGAAHILANGQVDPLFKPNLPGTIYTMALKGDTLFCGGTFFATGSFTATSLAAVRVSTGQRLAFNPNFNPGPTPNAVRSLLVVNDTLFLGGDFNTINNQSVQCLAAFNTNTLSLLPWQANVQGQSIRSMQIYNGGIMIAGLYNSAGGAPRQNIAQINRATAQATQWSIAPSGSVNVTAVKGDTLYMAGGFFTIGLDMRAGLAAVSLSGNGQVLPWQANLAPATKVNALAVVPTGVYAGGQFQEINSQAVRNVALLNAETGAVSPLAVGARSEVFSLSQGGNELLAGGAFTSVWGVNQNYVGAINVNSGKAISIPISFGLGSRNTFATSIAVDDSTTYIANLATVNGVNSPGAGVLRVNRFTGQVYPSINISGSGLRNFKVKIVDSTIMVFGYYSIINGIDYNGFCAFKRPDVSGGTLIPLFTPVTGGATFGREVDDVQKIGNTFFVAGARVTPSSSFFFTAVAEFILNGNTLIPTAWNTSSQPVNFNSANWRITPGPNELYVIGNYSSIGGALREGLGALDYSFGVATSFNPPNVGVARNATLGNDILYTVGHFAGSNQNGLGQGLAAISTLTGNPTGWRPSIILRNAVFQEPSPKILLTDSTVIVSGDFITAEGIPRQGLLIYPKDTVSCTAAAPNILAPNGLNVCGSPGVILQAGSGTNFIWSTGENTPSITVTSAGTYTLATFDGGCTTAVASVQVTETLGLASISFNNGILTASPLSADITYQWLLNGTPISGANSGAFTPSTPGNYQIAISRQGCSDTSAAILFDPVSIKGRRQNAVKHYPNPSNDQPINIMSNIAIQSVHVYDLLGKQIEHEWNGKQLRIKAAPAGSYLIEINTAEGRQVLHHRKLK